MSDENDNNQPPAEGDTRKMAASLWDKMQTPPADSGEGNPPGDQKAADPKPADQKKADDPKAPVLPKFIKNPGDQKAADPKPTDQKEAAPDFDKLTGPDEKSKHRPDWDKMKAAASEEFKKRTAAEARLAELEKKLAASGDPVANEATKARMAQLETQIKDYDAKLKVYDLQSHPDFVKQYVEPERNAAAQLSNLFKMEGVEGVDVAKLLALDGKKFAQAVSEALEDLTPFSRTTATQLFHQAKQLQQARSEALTKTDELREQFRQQQLVRARAAFDDVGKGYAETLLPMAVAENASPEEKAAADAYNAALAQVNTISEKLAFSATDERTVADMAHKAARFDFIVNHAMPRFEQAATAELTKAFTRIAELEAQVKHFTASQPRYQGGGDGGSGDGDGNAPRPGESTEAYARRLAASSGLFKG